MVGLSLNCPHCSQPLEANSTHCAKCGKAALTGAPVHRDGDEPTMVRVRLDDVLDGKWRLEKKIGEGGMGTVYLARDLQLDRAVAVKLLSPTLVGDEEITTRFEREARLTASMEHPGIVPVFAVGRIENRPFMVMKKLEGQTLSGLLREKGGLSLDETMALMRQLCSALDFIHSKGFVHRDIKSGNIFVGPDGHATILDFGILRSQRSVDALTRTGVVMGTPHYMSPEQALGVRELDHRSDLYALAVVLFEVLTGTLPFEADNELHVIQMQAHAPPPDLCERAPWIPRSVADVVRRGLSKRPEDRFLSGAQLLVALEAARLSASDPSKRPEPLSSAPKAFTGTSPGWRSRGQGAMGPLPSSAPSSTQAPVPDELRPSTVALRRTPGPPPSEPEPPLRLPRSYRTPIALAVLVLAGVGALGVPALLGKQPSEPSSPLEKAEPLADAGEALAVAQLDAGSLEFAGATEDGGELELALIEPLDAGSAGHVPGERTAGRVDTGKVNVITTLKGEPYWAEVTINGVFKGRTPLLLELPSGKHRLRIERAGFKRQEKQIRVASGRQAVVRIALTQ